VIAGVLLRLFLISRLRAVYLLVFLFAYAMPDSTILRAHQTCGGVSGRTKTECIGRSKGGLSTK